MKSLQSVVEGKLVKPSALADLRVKIDQVASSTFITIRKKGLKGLLGKKTETTLLEPTADGKSELIHLTPETLATKIAKTSGLNLIF